jgi:hypothetical protein
VEVNWVEFGAIAGIVTVVTGFLKWIGKALWTLVKTFEEMETSIQKIASNDLPHIYDELKDIRKDFMTYILEESQRGQDTAGFRRGDREDPTGSGHYPPDYSRGVRERENRKP